MQNLAENAKLGRNRYRPASRLLNQAAVVPVKKAQKKVAAPTPASRPSTSHPSMRAMELDGKAVGMKNAELVKKLRDKYMEEIGL